MLAAKVQLLGRDPCTDFTTARTTNSIRFEYLKFRNAIADGVALSGAPDPVPGISLNITPDGSDTSCLGGGEAFCSGANILAPQATFQTDKQVKYDGSYSFRSHTLRYGIAYNDIRGGGFAEFFGLQPMVQSVVNAGNEAIANAGPFPGGASNPENWPVDTIVFGNGQGFFTELPGFGQPAGGQFDHRLEWYLGDQWKMKSNLTLTLGLHYGRDTGRADSDLPGIPALAQFDNQFYHGLENRINQPNLNFGPQLGIAWDPWKSGKTVIRAGIGLYYENAIFNNVLFDRPARLEQGLFFGTAVPCFNGAATGPVQGVNGGTAVGYCGEAVGTAAAQIAADQTAYQAAVAAAGPQSNGSFVGNTLAEGVESTGDQLIGPDYVSPRSVQMNIGVQRQLGKNSVLSVDYVRNVGTHFLIGLDTNKDGDSRFLNVPNAQAAISATNKAFGCGTGFDSGSIQCAITAGATMADFAGNGLDSGVDFAAGLPCPTCAFPGVNPNVGQNQMLFPIGRSVYNGLLVSLKSNLSNPLPGMRRLSLIASYTLSRFDSEVQDQDFVNNATDFNNPLSFYGPSALDRTHQVSVGAVMDLPAATRLALTTHWDTAPATTLLLPQSGLPGEIFYSDVTGDGTVGDVAPGTNVGAFGRSITAGNLNNYISMYNSKYAGQITPAGQALVAAGLFTQTQLVQLGAVTPTLQPAPPGNVGLSPLFTFDAHVSWEIHLAKVFHALPERVVLEPQIALFNVFNFHNYDPGGNLLSGVLGGFPGSVNGTTKYDQAGCPADQSKCTGRTNLITPGSSSGVNWYAVPRQAEFGVRLSF